MQTLIFCIFCAALANSADGSAKGPLVATPPTIKLGVVQVGQAPTNQVILKNVGREALAVDVVASSCNCQKAVLGDKTIPPGGATTLKITTEVERPGSFEQAVVVIPRTSSQETTLHIPVSYTAVQAYEAEAGWKGKEPVVVNPLRIVDIGPVFLDGVVLRLKIREPIGSHLDPNDVTAVESRYFRLAHVVPETTVREKPGSRKALTVTLEPKQAMRAGAYRDEIRVRLANEAAVIVTASFTLRGSVYPEKNSLYLGMLRDPRRDLPAVKICYADTAKKWTRLQWSCRGPLAPALVIEADSHEPQESYDRIALSIDQVKLQNLPAGFLSCGIRFFSEDPNSRDALEVVVYGQH